MNRTTTFMILAGVGSFFIFVYPSEAAAKRSAASVECSKQADAKGLHGKARKKFRAGCLHGFKYKAG